MATGNTANYNLPYPVPTDPVDVAGDIQELSDSLDSFLTSPAFINNLSINGGSVVTSSATAALFNTGATTLNIGGAATVINVGASAGQVNVRGNFNIATGKIYEINDVEVLSASALGSGIVSSSLTAVGTITTGTWNATTIAVNRGGTGLTSYAIGDIIYASAATTLAKLAGVATGNALISGGVGVAPSWGKIGLATHVSGTLPIANGGTNGTATPTSGGVAYGTGSAYAFTAGGTTNHVLTFDGSTPVWTANTGTGSVVRATSPSLTTPNIGSATASYLTITGAGSGQEGGEMILNGSPTYSGVIIDNYAGYYRIIQQTPVVMMFSVETTDIKASANIITLNADVSGAPTDNVFFRVERGTSPDVDIRWNETSDAWQFTNNGSLYYDIPIAAGGGTGFEANFFLGGL